MFILHGTDDRTPAIAVETSRPRTRVRERAEEQATALTEAQQASIRTLANELHRLNHAVMEAVEAGVSVEFVRASRHHGGDGTFGDLMTPRITSAG
ncbi:hypothetical protein [Aureimonas sp. AU20]|uniref:SMc00767 family acetate metabolism repressor n=1 Tax=Aureimonas sp. AU20 TaxID=1349819 RepID=UPI000722AF06|nr:hypothetical protein [Aureimonas sp. AU20]ALN74871.1 hypothetical protein M673_19280 [Aureimonas sp. AU20]